VSYKTKIKTAHIVMKYKKYYYIAITYELSEQSISIGLSVCNC